jgi:hypothetical protein
MASCKNRHEGKYCDLLKTLNDLLFIAEVMAELTPVENCDIHASTFSANFATTA